MKFLKTLNTIFNKIVDLIAILIPAILFVIMFICFGIQIASRFIFHNQVETTYEICTLTFTMLVFLAGIHSSRKNEHVAFELFTGLMKPKMASAFRIIGKAIVLYAFIRLIPEASEFIDFMQIKKSPLLKIPMNYIYYPFQVFIWFSVFYLVRDVMYDLLFIFGVKKVFGFNVPRVHGATDSPEAILEAILEEQAASGLAQTEETPEMKEEVS